MLLLFLAGNPSCVFCSWFRRKNAKKLRMDAFIPIQMWMVLFIMLGVVLIMVCLRQRLKTRYWTDTIGHEPPL